MRATAAVIVRMWHTGRRYKSGSAAGHLLDRDVIRFAVIRCESHQRVLSLEESRAISADRADHGSCAHFAGLNGDTVGTTSRCSNFELNAALICGALHLIFGIHW